MKIFIRNNDKDSKVEVYFLNYERWLCLQGFQCQDYMSLKQQSIELNYGQDEVLKTWLLKLNPFNCMRNIDNQCFVLKD